MSEKKHTKKQTLELAQSLRGNFIIGKALYIAAQTLKKEENPPISDIKDMEEIGEALFPVGWTPTQIANEHTDPFPNKPYLNKMLKKNKKK